MKLRFLTLVLLVSSAYGLSAPTFSVAAGSYSGVQLVTISGPSGATICWNLGSVPVTNGSGKCTSGITYVAPAAVASSTTLYAIATESGETDSSTASAAYTLSFPGTQLMIQNSAKTYLINSQTANPVFITGDDAFDLATMLTWSNVLVYLQDRASRNFNAIWLGATDDGYQTTPPQNAYGYSPYDGSNFTNEDANYWAYIDSVIAEAAQNGITVFLNPFFVDTEGDQGYSSAITSASSTTMTTFGNFIGNRYKNYNNIVYLLGGDANPGTSGVYSKLVDVGAGIVAYDAHHAITLEACEQCVSNGYNSVAAFQSISMSVPSWLTINWAYPQTTTTVDACRNAYAQSPFLPPMAGENFYELDNSTTPLEVRWEMYTEVLSGCYTGRIFGNGAIWSYNSKNGDSCCVSGSPTWQSQLSSNGSVAESYQGQLFRSREHWLLVPDTTNTYLTAGYGSGTTMSTLARTSDGQSMIAYIPNGNGTTVTINMAGITSSSSTVKAYWYNPQTAANTLIGSYANSGSKTFTPPNGNDWVLVLDNAAAGLPAPGTSQAKIKHSKK
jgi:Protein of unknown function (DUF4038)/Putative collagen-binding domain of a collagenase